MKIRSILPPVLLVVLLVVGGCSSDEVTQLQNGSVHTTLCRKVGRKSGRRIGAGHQFRIGKNSKVLAFTDFEEVQTDRPYTVHLAWIRPDGKEMYRRYGEVRLQETANNKYQSIVRWLDAEDMHKIKTDTTLVNKPGFTLESRLNISTKKNRTPGDYHFRVYLDRRLLLDEKFQVIPGASVNVSGS